MMLRRHRNNRAVVNETAALETIPEAKEEEPIPYKRSDISRMGVADLRELATNLGIENAETTSGEKLKEAIIANLGL